MKFIKYILFILACFFAIRIVYWAFAHLLMWFIGLNIFWLIVVLILFSGTIWSLFKLFTAIIMMFTSFLSPDKIFSFFTVFVLSIINAIWAIYNSWTLDVKYSGEVIFGAIVFSILVIELTYVLIYSTIIAQDDNYYNDY